MPSVRTVLSAALLASALTATSAGAQGDADFGYVARTSHGGIAWRTNGNTAVATQLHFFTKCGTVRIPGSLPYGNSVPEFRYTSPDGRVKVYVFVDTSPGGLAYGFARDRRANGCSAKIRFGARPVA